MDPILWLFLGISTQLVVIIYMLGKIIQLMEER